MDVNDAAAQAQSGFAVGEASLLSSKSPACKCFGDIGLTAELDTIALLSDLQDCTTFESWDWVCFACGTLCEIVHGFRWAGSGWVCFAQGRVVRNCAKLCRV